MRRLIVNADDFGMTRGINRAIVEGCRDGIITSTTLMATALAFDNAIGCVHDLSPPASIGCHVILLDGVPALPPDQIPSLLSGSSDSSPEFRTALGGFAQAAFLGKLNPAEVEAEATAQIRRLLKAGVGVSHMDCHKHAHMFPRVVTPILRAANKCGVKAVRNPFGPIFPQSPGRILRNPKTWRRVTELAVLRSFAANFRSEVARHGIHTPDGSVGVLDTGTLDLQSFLQIVETLPEGTWEFVCHPGYNDVELDQVRTRLRQSRETELAVLTSPEARAALARCGIELISFHQL